MKVLKAAAAAFIPLAASVALASAAYADPPPNNQCAANGALIAYVAQLPGPNTGYYEVAPGAPNNPGQSIQFAGKTGQCPAQ